MSGNNNIALDDFLVTAGDKTPMALNGLPKIRLTDDRFASIAREEAARANGATAGEAKEHTRQNEGGGGGDLFRCTDLGNGERLVAAYGQDLRYCNQWKKWLTWDGTRWALDQTQTVRQWARLTIRQLYDESQRLTELAKNEEPGEGKETLVVLSR